MIIIFNMLKNKHLLLKTLKALFSRGSVQHAPLSFHLARQPLGFPRKYDGGGRCVLFLPVKTHYFRVWK